jgi:iron complex outermembrane receptor protein
MKLNEIKVGSLCSCLAVFAFSMDAAAQEIAAAGSQPPSDWTSRSLTELMDIEVRSPSRTPQKLSQVAAAVYVISQEDIRRSGATTIAEALRMAPGFDVARIDSSRWAISSRGFNDFFANKLLVLMDGRSVYTPLFSGVFWDVQDTLLEDIEQIEVIRGPGAAMWGANAVNGVINIITKNSADTQGTLISGGGGGEELGFGSIRYGGTIKEGLTYRAYVKYFNRDDFKLPNGGGDAADEWDMFRGGFRSDWKISDGNSVRLQGDAYSGTTGQSVQVPVPPVPLAPPPWPIVTLTGRGKVAGGNVLGSYAHVFSDSSDLRLQLYYDRTERTDQVHQEFRDTYDLDFQHRFELGSRQEWIWGVGYRLSTDSLGPGRGPIQTISFFPAERHDQLFSAFAQDVIKLREDLKFTLGTKVEHNSYTGWELQPNARLIWDPNEKNSLWTAVSRAVRTPARFEHTIGGFFTQQGQTGAIFGNPNYESEELTAYEIGYRVQPNKRVSFDVAGFFNDYENLRVFAFSGLGVTPQNVGSAETYGAELGANVKVTENWRLFAGYTFLKMQLHSLTKFAVGAEAPERESPQHQVQLRSYYDLPWHLELDASVYYVDALAARTVPGYTKMDVRLGWRPKENFELSIVGQNLLDNRHPEFGEGFLVSPTEIERSVYAKATWRF